MDGDQQHLIHSIVVDIVDANFDLDDIFIRLRVCLEFDATAKILRELCGLKRVGIRSGVLGKDEERKFWKGIAVSVEKVIQAKTWVGEISVELRA